MRPVPFRADWRMGPLVGDAFEARLPLDQAGWFAGHYPGAPIFPGSFLIEALVQAVTTVRSADLRLAEIVSCRFYSPLLPGDVLTARFRLQEERDGRLLVEIAATSSAPAAQLVMRVQAPALAPEAVAARPPTAAPSGRELDEDFILRALPHRPPALLVDAARVWDHPSPALVARRRVAATEPCFRGRDRWSTGAYPAMLVVESFCQSCGLLRAATAPTGQMRDEGRAPVVAKLGGIRFLGEAGPGDVLEHHVKLVVRTEDGAVFAGHTETAGRLVIESKRVVAALAPLGPRR